MGTPSGVPFGQYELIRRLARGGMAEVFLARQIGLEGFERVVAIKRILPHLVDNENFVRMFLDEARLAARLSHPNVVHIYEFGKVDEHYFIAMEFLPGVHAGDLIRMASREPLPPALVARLGADACAGLHYAHQLVDELGRPLHVVHRDVSPANLLLSYSGVTKIVDFGIAKAVSCVEQTRPGVVKGKYAYMSPEQTTGKKLDGRSDVFSLALVIWELLAGRVAVARDDQVAAMKMIRDGQVQDIVDVRPDVPPQLAAALRMALVCDPNDRCDAHDLGLALEEYIKTSDHMGTAMELGQWIRERVPPQPLYDSVEDAVGDSTRATRHTGAAPPGTRATNATPSAIDLEAATRDDDPPSRLLSSEQAHPEDATRVLRTPEPSMFIDPPPGEVSGGFTAATRALGDRASQPGVGGSNSSDLTAHARRMPLDDEGRETYLLPEDEDYQTTRDSAPPAPLATATTPTPMPPPFPVGAPTIEDQAPTIEVPEHSMWSPTGTPTADHGRPGTARGTSPSSAVPQTAPGAVVPHTSPGLPPPGRGKLLVAGAVLLATGGVAVTLLATRGGPSDAAADTSAGVVVTESSAGTADVEEKTAPDITALRSRASLQVITLPEGAEVILDDGRSMVSPALFSDLAPGPISVEVRMPQHKGVREEISLKPGTIERIEIELEALPAVADETPDKSDDRKSGRKTGRKTTRKTTKRDDRDDRDDRDKEDRDKVVKESDEKPQKVVGTGVLRVRTQPYSVVYIGKRKLGETPLAGVELPAGDYRLRLVNPDHEPVTHHVKVKAGETTKVSLKLP